MHIAAAAIWVGGGAMIQVFGLRVLAGAAVLAALFTVPTLRARPA